jgi:hypothetical protein
VLGGVIARSGATKQSSLSSPINLRFCLARFRARWIASLRSQ